MKQDRFLIGILLFIAALAAVSLALFFARGEGGEYGPEDTPQGVLRNYALAIQKMDYQRAYGYLAEGENKPTYTAFRSAFLTRQLDPVNSALQVGKVLAEENGEAIVEVFVLYPSGGLFDTGWSSSDRALLVRQAGAWKIIQLPYPYWGWDWYTPTAP